jgi:hypothetical protein
MIIEDSLTIRPGIPIAQTYLSAASYAAISSNHARRTQKCWELYFW